MPPAKGLPEASHDLTQGDWGYIAGLIDADGHIGIYSTKSLSKTVEARNYYLRLAITNTSYPLMTWLKEYLGGFVAKRPITNPGWAQTYNWHATQSHVGAILRKCRKYMRVKGEQADVAMKFLGAFTNQSTPKGMRPQVRAQRHEVWLEMARLKGFAHIDRVAAATTERKGTPRGE